MKKYIGKYGLFLGVLGLVSFAGSAQKLELATKLNRPNIIVFLVDDMGWQDTSLPFWTKTTELNKRYYTPNMERLAKEGMKFTNAYATPVCTPSRISMLTGMNAANHGVTHWTSPSKDTNSEQNDEQMESASWMINGLSPMPNIPKTVNATPFPELLKHAGYFTIHVGKAHWASMGTPGANPYNMGFMVNVSGHAAGHPQSYQGKDNYGNIPGKSSVQAVPDLEEYYGTDTFLTEALTQEAIKSLDAPIANKQPFYLNMAHYAVHDPIMADSRFVQKYIDAGLDPIEARYASLIEGMDKSLGDLMDFLKKKGIEKNTVIIFMSDNGGLSLVPPRGGIAHTHNLPLKAGKGSVYEGGIREPMIVKWPAVVKPSTTANQYVIIDDFFPTILEMAQVKKYKTIQTVDGKSFLPILKNPSYADNSRALIWHSPNKWIKDDGPGINYYSAIRQGDWKLVYSMRNGKKELYNLNDDIGENHNLSDRHPDKVNQLSVVLSNELRKYKAPMPSFKRLGKVVPMPDELK
jgi:arylsulfatase A-like enzyme